MYERYFELVDAPFRLTPDPRYLFLSTKHAEALAHLRLGLKESSGFVCISGDVGTGKTTLLRAFLADLGPDVATAYIFNPAFTALELIRRINREFGIAIVQGTQAELTEALHEHLLAQRKAGKISVVVIDEAQAFSIELLEQLRLLSNLETTTEKLLRVALVGQPELGDLLGEPSLAQLNQRITLRWHIGPLSSLETAAYVQHRLGVASRGRVTRLFTTSALRLIYRCSGGVPRLINMIAHHSMLVAFGARKRRVTARAVRHAYRELGAVPLPVKPMPSGRRVAWAATLAAVAVGLASLGAPRFGLLPAAPPPPPAKPEAALVPAAVEPVLPSAAASDAPAPTAPPALLTGAAPDAANPPGTADAELERGLAALDGLETARDATEAALPASRARPLAVTGRDLPALTAHADVATVRVVLPRHLRELASVGREVTLDVEGPVTLRSVLDALEGAYPMLRGTIRDPETQRRRPFVRFVACEEDWSHESPDWPLPEAVARGSEPFLVVAATAGE